MDQSQLQSKRPRIRRDGWTAERQLAFLGELARTRSVTKAARAVGMSRESAYRVRDRPNAHLFAAAWDGALKDKARPCNESHEGHGSALIAAVLRRRLQRAKVTKATKRRKCTIPRVHHFD